MDCCWINCIHYFALSEVCSRVAFIWRALVNCSRLICNYFITKHEIVPRLGLNFFSQMNVPSVSGSNSSMCNICHIWYICLKIIYISVWPDCIFLFSSDTTETFPISCQFWVRVQQKWVFGLIHDFNGCFFLLPLLINFPTWSPINQFINLNITKKYSVSFVAHDGADTNFFILYL